MEQQTKREAERNAVLARLADARKKNADYAVKRSAIEAEIREKQRALARHLETFSSTTLDQMEGQLRSLADPAITRAITEVIALADKAREAYKTTHVIERRVRGTRMRTINNALAIAELMARCRDARQEFEAMLTAPRPDDLDALLDSMLAPLRAAVARLHGF